MGIVDNLFRYSRHNGNHTGPSTICTWSTIQPPLANQREYITVVVVIVSTTPIVIMAPPRLRILAGSSPDSLVPITDIVNTTSSYKLSSDLFEGEIAVHIKDFTDEHGQVRSSDYFKREDRQGVTWSIQVSGRFLTPSNANDIMFGNIFDRRLKLPTGFGAALRFMQFMDPTLEHDLLSQTKPWALSPLIATMPHFSHQNVPSSDDTDADSISSSLSTSTSSQRPGGMVREVSIDAQDNASLLTRVLRKFGEKKSKTLDGPNKDLQFDNASQRQKYFRNAETRKQVELGPQDLISTDFCYGFLEFCPSLALRLPVGLTFDLMRYWDKHPVRFVCCERKKVAEAEKEGEDPWGRMFWCVMIEIADS